MSPRKRFEKDSEKNIGISLNIPQSLQEINTYSNGFEAEKPDGYKFLGVATKKK